jgi:hypothetical protein
MTVGERAENVKYALGLMEKPSLFVLEVKHEECTDRKTEA